MPPPPGRSSVLASQVSFSPQKRRQPEPERRPPRPPVSSLHYSSPPPKDAASTQEPPGPAWGLQGRPLHPSQPSPTLEGWEEASEWTSWFNVDHPGGDGDFESLAAIRFYYGPTRVCPRPLALEARTTDWALPSAVGERVHLSPARGFWCLNREQPRGRRCSNYHVRFRCPLEAAWGAWGPWGPCSGSCGPGRRLRRRSCPSPAGGACPGRPLEAQRCVRPQCPGRRGGASRGRRPVGGASRGMEPGARGAATGVVRRRTGPHPGRRLSRVRARASAEAAPRAEGGG